MRASGENGGKANFDRSKLETLHENFGKRWWRLVEDGLAIPNHQQALSGVLASWEGIKPGSRKGSSITADSVVVMMAHLFADWTLALAEHYRNNSKMPVSAEDEGQEELESNARSSYLMQPHAAQLVSIVRLLGLDETPRKNLSSTGRRRRSKMRHPAVK